MIHLNEYKSYLAFDRNQKPSTVAKHLELLQKLNREVGEITASSVKTYLIKLKEQGKSSSYLNKLLLAARVYGYFIKDIPLQDLKKFKTNRKTIRKDILTKEQIFQIIATQGHDKGYPKEFWDLLLLIIASTGMRPTECLSLRTTDISNNCFVVRDSKTGDNRLVPIPSIVQDAFSEHLQGVRGRYIFGTKNDTIMKTEKISLEFRLRLRKLSIPGNITLYSLRHSFITRLADEDVSLFKIQKLVGHKRIEQTAIYTHMTTKDITRAIQKDPLAKEGLTHEQKLKLFREAISKVLEDFEGLAEAEEARQKLKELEWF